MINDLAWTAFLPSAALLAATPGANQLLVFRNGLRHGVRPAVGATLGRFTAFALMVVAVAAGLGAVLTASAVAFNAVKWCGVAYLLWLGARTIVTAWRTGPGQRRTVGSDSVRPATEGVGPEGVATEGVETESVEPEGVETESVGPEGVETESVETDGGGRGAWVLARQEFLVAASNPKAFILFAVFLPQFLPGGAEHVAVPLLVLGAAYIGVEFCCAIGYAAVGGVLKRRGGGVGRSRRLLDTFTGVAMVGLAGWLATENR
ncbi:LysE family translocator [Streptomyces sp. NPDC007346]|uniref:LysE family translocator n=1 Tax=Streptomyces sp. NPDC007346 TaxID=3154682 RepID=UPI003451B8B2